MTNFPFHPAGSTHPTARKQRSGRVGELQGTSRTVSIAVRRRRCKGAVFGCRLRVSISRFGAFRPRGQRVTWTYSQSGAATIENRERETENRRFR
jgi:hypothetical protein